MNISNISRISTAAFVLTFIVLTLWLSGCDQRRPMLSDVERPTQAVSLPIGVVVSETGIWADLYELPMQRGFALALEEINAASLLDVPLSFVTIDDESTLAGSTQAVQELVDQGVPAIVGLGISTHFIEAAPIAQANGVIAFSSLSSAADLSEIGDFVFRAPLPVDLYIPSGIAATREKLGYETAALIYDAAQDYATSSNTEIEKALTASGVEILATETFETGDTNFSEQLDVILAQSPDVLFISALGAEIVEILTETEDASIIPFGQQQFGQQWTDANADGVFNIQDFILDVNAEAREAVEAANTVTVIVPELSADEMQKAGEAAEGVITFLSWSALSDTPGNRDFVANYLSKYEIAPEPWAAQSYATLYILANAIDTAESTDAAAIRDALAATRDFPTILGNFSFDANGEAMYAPIVLRVTDGELRLFE